MDTTIRPLPTSLKEDGSPRRVGLEFEFSGLDLDEATEILLASLGGTVIDKTAANQTVAVDDFGEFIVEVDWAFLKRISRIDEFPTLVKDLLSDSAQTIVPIEIVCPPLDNQQLQKLNTLVVDLREAKAKGTEDSFLFAFGLHINVELPALDATTLDRYIKAYALLQGWLLEQNSIDFSRRLTPYVDLYPDEYLLRVIRREQATLSDIFSDYLEHNPSRNRALDLLPLLAHIDEQRVRECIDDSRIKARPAFHYRLPDCRIDNPQWSLAEPWRIWCAVEYLADDQDLLKEITEQALQDKDGKPMLMHDSWHERVNAWLPVQE